MADSRVTMAPMPISEKMVIKATNVITYEKAPQLDGPKTLAAYIIKPALKSRPKIWPKNSQKVFLAMVCLRVWFSNRKDFIFGAYLLGR